MAAGRVARRSRQKGKVFAPGAITVKVGDAVSFKNDDDVTHNAFSTSKGNEFNAKAQTPGSTSEVVFKTKGKVGGEVRVPPGHVAHRQRRSSSPRLDRQGRNPSCA